MNKADFLGFMVDIDNTTFEDYIETIILNKENPDYLNILLNEIPDNFYDSQNNNSNDLKRSNELCNISNLHYHFNWEDFKRIMSKKKLNYLSDYSYFIYKGHVSLNDYLTIVENRMHNNHSKHYYVESELAYILCLTTENTNQEQQLLEIVEDFFKNSNFKHGGYKFLIPNVNIFLNDLFFNRLVRIYLKNKRLLDIYNSLIGKKSIFKMSFVKCFDFPLSIKMLPFNILLSLEDYHTILNRMEQLIDILKESTSDQTYRYLEIVNYKEHFSKNFTILNEEFINNIGKEKLEKHIHSPLQNIYKLASTFITDADYPKYDINVVKLELYNDIIQSKVNLEDMFDWIPEED